MRHRFVFSVLVLNLVFGLGPTFAQDQARTPAVPIDPTNAIIDAFEMHQLVALTSVGYEEEHDFWLSLLREYEFVEAVDDIVVEFGASRYQDTIDTFTNGGQVPYEELEKVWQQTTQPHQVSDAPMYEDFFRAVREINGSLPKDDQIRILLAEPPIDWSRIRNFDDLLPWLQRRFPYEAELVQREVLSKNRTALLISGAGHFLEGTPLISSIEATDRQIFKIWTPRDRNLVDAQPSVASWPAPSLARIGATVLGMLEINTGNAPPAPLEEQFDAALYLGPPSNLTEARIAPQLCSDQEYLDMRLPRLQMAADNGAPQWLEEFVQYCDNVE